MARTALPLVLLVLLLALLRAASAAPQAKLLDEALRRGMGAGGALSAGASRVDTTLPVGAPLAGYNYPPRRAPGWPLPHPGGQYTTWMNPSQGIYDPNYVKALVLDANGVRLCWLALDFIGADDNLLRMAYDIAQTMGFTVAFENVLLGAAHTHSSGGAVSSDFLWSIAPATDLVVPELQRYLATNVAKAMVLAEQALRPAKLDVGTTELPGVTHNRRAGFSPYVTSTTVDTQLGVIRVDDAATGSPLATLWNFAIHGICYDAPNMMYTSDVMGAVNTWVEKNIGGVSLFANADAGDVNPVFSVCCQNLPFFSGGPVIGAAIQKVHAALAPSADVELAVASSVAYFGNTQLNLTLARVANCTRGGPLDVCSLCLVLDCDANIELDASWIQNEPRFTGIRLGVNGKRVGVVSIPGEALTELGRQIRNDTLALGFDTVLLAGYSNGHLGYFAPPDEYLIGGYESLLTFWGIGTSELVRQGCAKVAALVRP